MRVAMIDVRKVRMFVPHCEVLMHMIMRRIFIPIKVVRMIVMPVTVCMQMGMCGRLMRVVMLMVFGQMQPDTHCHQRCRRPEQRRCRFAQQHQ